MTAPTSTCSKIASCTVGLGLALGCLFAGDAAAQVRQPRAYRLFVELGGERLPPWFQRLALTSADQILFTVGAHDSAGRPVPISDFEIEVWDPRVAVIVSQSPVGDQMSVQLRPLRHGQTTIQMRASGVRDWVSVEVLAPISIAAPAAPRQPGVAGQPPPGEQPPAVGEQPPAALAGAPSPGYWFAGGRINFAAYRYSFQNDTTFTGSAGFFFELFGGRAISPNFSLALDVALGSVKADSVTTPVTASLLELYLRADYSFLPAKKASPVLSLGGGGYRIRTGSANSPGIWNTSLFWTVTGGVDVVFTPKVTGEVRIGTQQLYEATSSTVNGHVGSLFVVGVGARFKL